MCAVARGARSKNGSKRIQLTPFCPLGVEWRGTKSLKTLVRAEAPMEGREVFVGQTAYVGLYVNELLIRLLVEGDPHEGLYDRYTTLLLMLPGTDDLEPLLRVFELALLEDIGYGLTLDTDHVSGAPVRSESWYQLVPGDGLIETSADEVLDSRSLFPGAHLLAMAESDYRSEEVKRSAKLLLRCALSAHLGKRPLRSRELFGKYSVDTARHSQ